MQAYSTKYKYIIVWSAKSGCTLFRQLFLYLHKNELKKEPTNQWHSLERDFPISGNINDIKKIILCRNPYYRVVSMFCNKYCGGTVAVLPKKFNLSKCTFREFVKQLKIFKDKGNLNKIDCHIEEQKYYDSNSYIVKIENFNESIKDAYIKMNLKNLIPEIDEFLKKEICINKTKRRNLNNDYVYDKLYTVNSTDFPDYKYFYDKELIELVYQIYKSDFINFNYDKNPPF